MNYKLTQFSLHECMSLYADARVWEEAFEYLKASGDVDGWIVMLYGA